MRRLHLLRHAKSSWADEGLDDHDRPLDDRGRRACGALTEHLSAEQFAPDLVVVSTARRAVETVEGISGTLRPRTPIWSDARLYAGAAELVRAVIADVPTEARSLLVVGHNPAIEDLANDLIGDHASDAAVAVREKYPTGALVTFDVTGSWTTLAGPRLLAFVRPRDLAVGP